MRRLGREGRLCAWGAALVLAAAGAACGGDDGVVEDVTPNGPPIGDPPNGPPNGYPDGDDLDGPGDDDREGFGLLGLVADNALPGATALDVDAIAALGTVAITPADEEWVVGDCAVVPRPGGHLGFVTDFWFNLWVIDLSGPFPALAAGTNPIPISNPGEDIAVSPDGRYLVVCDGNATAPVSVVDIDARAEVSTFDLGHDCNSVDVCPDGSVLVTSVFGTALRRLTLDAAGILTDTGEAIFSDDPNNVVCAPGGGAGVLVERGAGRLRSFTIPLAEVDVLPLGGTGISAVFAPSGDQVHVRTTEPGMIRRFGFTPATGALSPFLELGWPVAETETFYGIDQLAIHPEGLRLYVPEPGRVRILERATGDTVGEIPLGAEALPTGICLETEP
jgi:hypothetical protein